MINFEKNRSSSTDYLYRQFDTNLNFDSHFHDSYEFIYVYEGEINITVSNKLFVVKNGEGLLVLPNQIHSYQTNNYSKTFILIFATNYVASYYKTSTLINAINPILSLENNEYLISELVNENDVLLLKSDLYRIIYLYNQKEMEKRNDEIGNISKQLMSFIESNYQSDISLSIVADKLGYSYHYLSSVFNSLMKCNFQTFINEYRINKFCDLLINNSDVSIANLAYEVGYTSLRSFNRNFMRFKKVTPKEYKLKLFGKNI